MRAHRICVLLVLTAFAAGAFAQAAVPLPKTMSGRWTTVYPNGRVVSDTMSVVLDVAGETGPVTGRLTSRGWNCGATDEPLTGTWNGTELRFESQLRPNVNTQRANGQCGTGRTIFVLTRKPGQAAFEGESRTEGAPTPDQMTLAP